MPPAFAKNMPADGGPGRGFGPQQLAAFAGVPAAPAAGTFGQNAGKIRRHGGILHGPTVISPPVISFVESAPKTL